MMGFRASHLRQVKINSPRSGQVLGVALALALPFACTKTTTATATKKCIDRDAVAGKMEQAVALLQDGAKASREHSSVSAATQFTSAAGVVDSIAEDLAIVPNAAGEMRVAAARLRAAVAEVRRPGGDDAAAKEINEATKHFKAASDQLGGDGVPFCAEPQKQ